MEEEQARKHKYQKIGCNLQRLAQHSGSIKIAVIGMACLGVAGVIWVPIVHLLFVPEVTEFYLPDRIAPKTEQLMNRQLQLWADPKLRAVEVERMRHSNAEWDFMGRTFLVMALANAALHEPAREEECLAVIDTIIEETLRLEAEEGHLYFLMGYAEENDFLDKAGRSLFVDGEIAMMLAARRLVREKEVYVELYLEKQAYILSSMLRGEVLSAESYPNECWMFCNSAAIAALKMGQALGHEEAGDFPERWLSKAKERLLHKDSGLLISSFTLHGDALDGPEGSSIWFVGHCLELVDETFARAQLEKARIKLYRELMGFGYSKEWPQSWVGNSDIDSGPIVPVLEASAGSSGLALLASTTLGDEKMLTGLLTSLNLGAFPEGDDKTLRYNASNQVGDAVLLYSLVHGPLWKKVKEANR